MRRDHVREGRLRAGRPALLLLHALPLDARMWAAQVSSLGELGTVLAPDLPGFGAAPPSRGRPSVDAWARDLAIWLRGQGIERVVVAGSSMGGYVALAFLRVAPGMLAGIALVGSRTAADTEAQRAGRMTVIERITREGAGPWAREFVKLALSPRTLKHKPDVVRRVEEIIASQRAESIIAAQQALADRPDSTDVWVSGPENIDLAIIHGIDDAIVPFDEAVALARKRVVMFDGVDAAGHLPPIEQPEEITNAIGGWWRRCGSS